MWFLHIALQLVTNYLLCILVCSETGLSKAHSHRSMDMDSVTDYVCIGQ